MTLDQLKDLIESGKFHHATYRNVGTLWEGLHIYQRNPQGFRGYEHIGAFLKDNPNLKVAENMVAKFGTSFGAYGRG